MWEFKIWKKLQEMYMNRILFLQLTHLIRAGVAFCTHGNKKSAFLPDFSYFKIIKKGSNTNVSLIFLCPFIDS